MNTELGQLLLEDKEK